MAAVEPIADAVTESLAARAAEPETGVDSTGHTTERACLNCRTALIGDYCHACGQKGHVHRSLGAFAHDLLHGVFHFEGKVWRTLPMLALRPGELTRRYIEGQRATFVGPLPLFLFGIFLMFAVVSQTGSTIRLDPTAFQADMAEGLRHEEAELNGLRQQREQAVRQGRSTAQIDSRIRSAEQGLVLARQIARQGGGQARDLRASASFEGLDSLEAAYLEAKQNPDLLLLKLRTNGYKYSWALIPLSLPLMWLLFPMSRRWRMYDHTVFVTYSLCFMTLLVVAGSLWRLTGLGGTGLLLLIPPIHMYRQLRGAYELKRSAALWRTVILSFGAVLIAVLFGLGLLLLGLFD